MKAKIPYSYTVLRYVHDVATGEFVNVGVVMHSPEERFLGAIFKSTYGRVKSVFPTLHSDAFKQSIRALEGSFKTQKAALSADDFNQRKSLLEIVHSILPKDDSSLQWSAIGSGISSDLDDTLKSIFARLVAKYDEVAINHKRQDEDVWKKFSHELQQRKILQYFASKTLSVADDSVEFKHAWKNGEWHCVAPVSFDLSSPDSIKDKAHKWLGKLASVQNAKEDCKLYFIIGKPRQPSLEAAVNSAVKILGKSPFPCDIYTESETNQLLDLFEKKIAAHEKQRSLGGNIN